jgi:hypothetical protein
MITNFECTLLCSGGFVTMSSMTQNTARKMRRLANLLGCREGEIPQSSSSPEREVWTILLLSNMFLLISTFVISFALVCEDS